MSFARKFRTDSRFRTITIVSGACAVVLVGVGAAGFAATMRPAEMPVASTSTPAPSVTEAAEPLLNPPSTAHVAATFTAWGLDGNPVSYAEGGEARDGAIALLLSADGTQSAVNQTLTVQPSTEYTVSLSARSSTSIPAEFQVQIGGAPAEPALVDGPASEWREYSWKYTTSPTENEINLSLFTSPDSTSFRLDSVSATAAGSDENIVVNGSFEDYAAPRTLTNTSLVLRTDEAALGVSWKTPVLDWTVLDYTGAAVDSGTIQQDGGIGMLPLGDLPQGFYTASFTDPAGSAAPIETTFMVLDEDLTARDAVDTRFGVLLHLDRDYYLGSEDDAAALGFGAVRTDVRWNSVEKTQGVYSFPEGLSASIAKLESHGIEVLPIAAYRNPFYDGNKVPSSPEAINAYAGYTNAMVGNYAPTAVEIFNEFNHPPVNNSACGPTPECYMQLLSANADVVHANHPGTRVVGPANAHKDDAFLTSLYKLGALNYLDVVSFHPYDYDYGDNKGAEFLVESLTQAQDRIKEYNGGVAKPIWLTEMGWTSTLVKSDNLQADYLVRAQAISLGTGVERFYWYDLVNDHLNILDHEGNFGLLRRPSETIPAFQPKLAAMAQAVLVSKIGGKEFSSRDELDDTTFSYAYGNDEDTTRVAWSTTPASVTFAAKQPVTLTDQYGGVSVLEPKKGVVTVELGEQTVYVDGALGAPKLVK